MIVATSQTKRGMHARDKGVMESVTYALRAEYHLRQIPTFPLALLLRSPSMRLMLELALLLPPPFGGAQKPNQRQGLQRDDDQEGHPVSFRRIAPLRTSGPQPNHTTDACLDRKCPANVQHIEGCIGPARGLPGKKIGDQGIAQHGGGAHAGDDGPKQYARYRQSAEERQFSAYE